MQMFRVILGAWLAITGFQVHAISCGDFPPRGKIQSWSSKNFYRQYAQPNTDRELAVVEQVLKGNVPDFLRQFIPLRFGGVWKGYFVEIEIAVAPDYLSIGTNTDFVRTPLTNFAAQYLASEMGLVLPTPFLVDRIYEFASTQLTPQPTDWYKDNDEMRRGLNYVRFNETIELQRQRRGGLIAGHKKDVVVTKQLDKRPQRVAIYGWQQPGNIPIQPLSLAHNIAYEDYSHGIRFLGPKLKIRDELGTIMAVLPLAQAYRDPELGSLLNGGDGALHDVRAGRKCSWRFLQATGLNSENCPPEPRRCP